MQPEIGIGGGVGGASPYATLTQQIAEQVALKILFPSPFSHYKPIRIAVSKGLIDVSMLSHPPPQNALVILNILLQKLPKLEQAQQEYQQVVHTMSSPAQKQQGRGRRRGALTVGIRRALIMKAYYCAALLDGGAEWRKTRPNAVLNGTLAPVQQQDGQSRLQQWKQANAQDCTSDKHRAVSDCSELEVTSPFTARVALSLLNALNVFASAFLRTSF
ncbi:unnamed protein product [Gongylonema pulchrum]|uniref:Uncharacterized protein n=1 Tax=Gongylonema pulchrum TaxID=637853 RepID=A0A183E6I8_9BILA|nr:unnamed protein product [Gongylonema pulchrum]